MQDQDSLDLSNVPNTTPPVTTEPIPGGEASLEATSEAIENARAVIEQATALLQEAATLAPQATDIQMYGAAAFGIIIGWYVYFINRYRESDVQIGDLVTILGIIGGGAILNLFEAGTDLFGAYGIGLFIGFFSYFIILIFMVGASKNFDADWFLDGRRKKLPPDYEIPGYVRQTRTSMNVNPNVDKDEI